MLLIDSRVWLLGIICCLLGGGIRAEEFAVIKGKSGGKVPAREVQLMTVENGGFVTQHFRLVAVVQVIDSLKNK